MKTLVTTILAATVVLCIATAAFAANKYPPGPGGTCPDTASISKVQDTGAACHPALLDTVLGVGGIVTAFDAKPSAFAVFFETSGGGLYAGVQAFTGATNYNSAPYNLALGDSIVVYGTTQEFPASNGTTEIEGPDVVQGTNDIVIRKVGSGYPIPLDIVTTHDINWVPASGNGEKYEEDLVRIRGPLRVGRTSLQGGLPALPFNSFLVVLIASPAESVLVEGNLLTTVTPPAAGTVVDSVQGIVIQNTTSGVNSFRISIRNGNDLFLAVPPNLVDAYPVEDNKLRLVFDRNVDVPTAEDETLYHLGSEIDGSTVDVATVEGGSGSAVLLDITSVRVDGDAESITASGIGAATCPTCLMSQQSRNFTNGVLDVATVQAADPAFFSPCEDRSRFAGPGATAAGRVSVRGVGMGIYGSLQYLGDAAGGVRSGLSVFGPSSPLTEDRQFLIVGQIQEFGFETELVNNVYLKDEGAVSQQAATEGIPIAALTDTTCDPNGPAIQILDDLVNGEDYEGAKVKLRNVRVTETRTIGQSFFVAGECCTFLDTILVSNLNGVHNLYTPPDSASTIDVTGILHFANGTFRICPRRPSDIVDHGVNAGANNNIPARLEFNVFPNPGRVSRVSFGLPRRDEVEIGVFDIAGRRIATVAKGTFDAGPHSRAWDGLDSSGKPAHAGMYFYRIRFGPETQVVRAIKLN